MRTKETFADRIKRIMGERIPLEVPTGKWHGIAYAHIYADLEDNFIDGVCPKWSCLKGELTTAQIKYHNCATHVNSSQIMCINFFKKFFEKREYETYLIKVLQRAGIPIASDEKIKSAAFEYEPCPDEGTNFDFYLVLSGGNVISFEIKYTEAGFGGITPNKEDPQKYERKWESIYKEMVRQTSFLDVDKDEFYKHYQINRNIVYAKYGDYVIFLTPKANDAKALVEGRKYIDELENPHILNLYWEDIMTMTEEIVKECDELKDYYAKFAQKYIEILDRE